MKKSADVRDRFGDKVYRIPGGCWIWLGATHAATGYGRFNFLGEVVGAHRASWELYRGPIPDGAWVLHDCPGGDDKACVNPNHLKLGTVLENNIDIAAKGAGRRGQLPYGVVKKPSGTYQSKVTRRGRSVHLGTFATAQEASLVALRNRDRYIQEAE